MTQVYQLNPGTNQDCPPEGTRRIIDACSLLTVYVYLRDHRAETLTRVVDHVEAFARANDTADTKFLLAAGSAGIEAATNIVVKDAWGTMLLLVYAAVVAKRQVINSSSE